VLPVWPLRFLDAIGNSATLSSLDVSGEEKQQKGNKKEDESNKQ
jgi:hypothetical protein